MSDVEAIAAKRVRDLYDWRLGQAQERIGAGKYGRVYSVGPGCAAILKESVTRRRAGMCKQAFREHIIGLLQTLLVLEACTPHLPLHYGAAIAAGGRCMRGRMYMERFEGSLVDLGGCLGAEADWLSLLFQLTSTFAALALLFGVTHNDAYPRNILISPRARARRVVYRCQGRSYVLHWPFLAALTDFGIATSPLLMGKRTAPEVSEHLSNLEVPSNFASCPPQHHILKYKSLPLFSRDVYTVLKWTCFADSHLPAAPPAVRLWARTCLHLLDEVRENLSEPQGLVRFFHAIFATERLAACGLSAVEADGEPRPDFTFPPDDDASRRMLAQAAAALRGIPLAPLPARSPLGRAPCGALIKP